MSRWFKQIVRCGVITLWIFGGGTGCNVAEDESDCIMDISLKFHFTKEGQECFSAEIPSISVFVFDEQDRFIGRWDENDNTKFHADYTMALPILPGKYRFVVWGGLKSENFYLTAPERPFGEMVEPVSGETTRDQMLLRLRCRTAAVGEETKNYVDFKENSQYYGESELQVLTHKSKAVTIDLIKNTTQINLTLKGLSEETTRSGAFSHIVSIMESPNGGYDFSNRLEQSSTLYTYIQHEVMELEEGTQTSSFQTLKMQFNNGHYLTIHNQQTDEVIYRVDILEDYIRKVEAYSTQQAVDATDRFDIVIDMQNVGSLGVRVTVNGWRVNVSGGVIQ